jgi:hypothetical protein
MTSYERTYRVAVESMESMGHRSDMNSKEVDGESTGASPELAFRY